MRQESFLRSAKHYVVQNDHGRELLVVQGPGQGFTGLKQRLCSIVLLAHITYIKE